MGFSEENSKQALIISNGNISSAIEHLTNTIWKNAEYLWIFKNKVIYFLFKIKNIN